MPTQTSASLLTKSNADVLNAVRLMASEEYQIRVPEATRATVDTTWEAITDYTPTMNEFINIVNKIGLQYLANKPLWVNPLAQFKKGLLPYGSDIEIIFIGMSKAKTFNQEESETNVWKREFLDSETRYLKENRRDFYKITITEDMWAKAFTSEYGLSQLISQEFDGLVQGDYYDEYIIMRQLLGKAVDEYTTQRVTIPRVVDNDSAKAFVKEFQTYAELLPFFDDQYNQAGVMTRTPFEDQLLFITPRKKAEIGVELLAQAFNIAYAEVPQRVVTIDYFPNTEENIEVQAMLVDRDWFAIFDTKEKGGELYNPEGLYTNYWRHHHQVVGVNPFANCIPFVSELTPEEVEQAKQTKQPILAPDETTDTLENMSVKELKALAQDLNITIKGAPKKEALIEIIKESEV